MLKKIHKESQKKVISLLKKFNYPVSQRVQSTEDPKVRRKKAHAVDQI